MTAPPPPTAPSKKRIWFVLIALTVVAAIVAYAATRPAPQTNSGGRRIGTGAPVAVGVAEAHKGDIAIKYQALGTVTPIANITVRTQISGYLLDVTFQEGQIVQKDDLLAEVDSRAFQLSKTQAEGSLTRDQALLSDAELNLSRYKKLFAQDSIAKQQLTTQEALVEQYRGSVKTDQGLIDAAKLNIEYCHIKAPVTGRVGLRQVDPGNYVQTSDANGIVTLTQLQPTSVIFALPEDDLPSIMKRLKDGAQLDVTAFDRTRSVKLADGRLSSVDNQVDTTTGTVKLRAQFDNVDNSLFPNQFVNVDILVDTLHDAVVIPTAAIQHGSPGTFVYLVNADKTVTVRVVKLGPDEGLNTSVTDGLAEGDTVVVDGLDKLRDGSKITLPSNNPSDTTQPQVKHSHPRSDP